MSWYHGTNQRIETFKIDKNLQGLNTASATVEDLVYFTDSPEVAADYALAASKKMYAEDHLGHEKRLSQLLDRYNRQLDQGLFDQAEKTYETIELLETTLKEDNSGQCIYSVKLFPKKTLVHDFGMREWGNPGTEEILRKAKDEKVDVLFVTNVIDQPSLETQKSVMTLAVVLNCKCIKFATQSKKPGITPEHVKSAAVDFSQSRLSP